jgi:aarF domain-containing kinase
LHGVGLKTASDDLKAKKGVRKYAMNDRNAERLSTTLCKMRGAELKIGQILSNMEDHVIPPTIKHSLERARKEADIMPKAQVTQML